MPLLAVISLQDETKFIIWEKSYNVFKSKFVENHMYQRKEFSLKKGDVILLRGDTVHAGNINSANLILNIMNSISEGKSHLSNILIYYYFTPKASRKIKLNAALDNGLSNIFIITQLEPPLSISEVNILRIYIKK